jgi:hypothetical protein
MWNVDPVRFTFDHPSWVNSLIHFPLSSPRTQISHAIKLYPPGSLPNMVPTDTETPVVAEYYDEVVFTNPTESFYGQMMRLSSAPTLQYSQQAHFGKFADNDDFQALLEADKFLKQELTTVKERLLLQDGELAEVDEGLREVQERKASQPSRPAAKSAPRGPAAASGGVASSKKAKPN